MLNCQYSQTCSGCPWIEHPDEWQRSQKIQLLHSALQKIGLASPEIEFVSIGTSQSRDRVDFTLESTETGQNKGFYRRGLRQILDVEYCAQLSPELNKWYEEFRQFEFPVRKGSVRLRVSPSGQKGAWLDFANTDIKALLDGKSQLQGLKEMAVVEIGQKKKVLVERNGELKLADPQLAEWFSSYSIKHNKELPLLSYVSSFTQPGVVSNRALVQQFGKYLVKTQAQKVLEFGSGIGNFTLPAAEICEHVTACEMDQDANLALHQSAERYYLQDKIKIQGGDFQSLKKSQQIAFQNYDLVMVDPPRSGLKQFIQPLLELSQTKPAHFIYVSCYLESFISDTAQLVRNGYQLKEISIVDQFPQSEHFEIIARFQIK